MITRILPVILILIAVGAFVGYVSPTYSKSIVPLQQDIKQYNNTLKAAQEFNEKEAQLATERNGIPQDAIARLMAFLPDGVDNIQLILDVNSLAARSGVKLSDFDVKASSDPLSASDQSSGALPLDSASSPYDSLDLSVKATGTYSAFRTFLAGLEQSLRPLDVVQLNVTPGENGSNLYDLTLRIYWLH